MPDYPETRDRREKAIRALRQVHRLAVNPVLREGNSDRRAPKPSRIRRKHPHSMGEWSQASRTHVSHMHAGDFYHGEKSMTWTGARREDGADHQERQDHRAQAQGRCRRDHRLHVHEQEGAVRLLRKEIEDAARPA
jgi:monomeric isocitrate dehydrogenase